MSAWSPWRTLLAGAVLIGVTNGAALVSVRDNRRGEPEAVLKLSQRELSLPMAWGFESENSGLALDLRFRVLPARARGSDALTVMLWESGPPEWLDAAKLAALGFEVPPPDTPSEHRVHYDRQLPKQVLLVLELDGPAYAEALRRGREAAARKTAEDDSAGEWVRKELARQERDASRLFVVDAGLDLAGLRRTHPDRTRTAIVRGEVRVSVSEENGRLRLNAHVGGLASARVSVPHAFRPVFEPLLQASRSRPSDSIVSYEVRLAFGRRLEPWVTAASAQ